MKTAIRVVVRRESEKILNEMNRDARLSQHAIISLRDAAESFMANIVQVSKQVTKQFVQNCI